jgi:polyphosphate glucokinase
MTRPAHPTTLCLDLGATRLKAGVVDRLGAELCESVWAWTVNPCDPESLLRQIGLLAARVPRCDRASVGFPGMVRAGKVLAAPLFWGDDGPGSPESPVLLEAWTDYDFQLALESRLGCPCRVENDSQLHAAAVVEGVGVEVVLTLGTGIGSTFAKAGRFGPHLELAHHQVREGLSYNDFIGTAALEQSGVSEWRRRVATVVEVVDALTRFDRLYLGGGNARLLDPSVDDRVTIVDPMAATRGGAGLWDQP